MFKKLKTAILAAAMPLGLLGAVGGITAGLEMTGAAPAFASGCGGLASEETNLDLYAQNDQSGFVYAFATAMGDGATDYGASLGDLPTGTYAPYGDWIICYTWQGTDSVGNYGLISLWNYGTHEYLVPGETSGGTLVFNANDTSSYQMVFQCTPAYGAEHFYIEDGTSLVVEQKFQDGSSWAQWTDASMGADLINTNGTVFCS